MKSPSSYSVQKRVKVQPAIHFQLRSNICLREEEDEEEEEAASATVSDPFGTEAVTPALCPVAITRNFNK